MKAFVTGGSGFVGRCMIRMLCERGDEVIALARSEQAAQQVSQLGAKVVRGDLLDVPAMVQGMQECDVVFHIAGFLSIWGKYKAFYKTNVIGTECVLAGRRWMMLIGLLGASIGYLLFALGGSLSALFVGWSIVGLTDGVASAVFATVADTTTPRERTRAFSWASAAIALGLIVGPILSSILSRFNPIAPVYAVAIAFLTALIWGWFVMPESLPKSGRSKLTSCSNSIHLLNYKATLRHLKFAG